MASRIDGVHHLRSTPRYKLFQPTEMSAAGETRRVHLLNLSTSGALIYAADPPPLGSSIRVRCGVHWLSARVAWRNQRRLGVAFAQAMSDADVGLIIAVEAAALAVASRRTADL
ncbi:PilZ domain-containing protein [Sphingomonas oligophenolica]|uniref:PilZ domain-containing protein n=1 Tax=Sphingomonas oligophenolica TaxID=301154 RepID=A0A502C6A1_9SPHN|nr:PilZ domain-containing protein [Sphingomonas oligophenolica]TPG07499.1 PilZ domain-containing protein [Sphingomonas oligophenolica]